MCKDILDSSVPSVPSHAALPLIRTDLPALRVQGYLGHSVLIRTDLPALHVQGYLVHIVLIHTDLPALHVSVSWTQCSKCFFTPSSAMDIFIHTARAHCTLSVQVMETCDEGI